MRPLNRVLQQFGGVLEVQLLLDARPVRFHGWEIKVQALGDLVIVVALTNQFNHLQFAI